MPYLLIAEDDEDDCLLAEEAWEETGAKVDPHFVHDGQSLLHFLQKEHNGLPSLILLDLNMPVKDGREALLRIKENVQTRSIPVVVMSTSNSPDDIEKMYAIGASGFITKPNSFSELVEVMTHLKNYWFETVKLPAFQFSS